VLRPQPSFLAASPRLDATVLARCRDVPTTAGRGACTLLPGLLIARWLGPACEPARNWLANVWAVLRPVVAGREAVAPRIWNT
jgi:urease accessory protein